MSEPLIARWLDDRAGVTEDEALQIRAALNADPELARQVKDQLETDELLSRRLSVDRSRFEAQVAQRIATAGSAGTFTRSTLQALGRTRRFAWAPEAAAAALLIAGLLFLLLRRETPRESVAPAASRQTGLAVEYYRDQFLKGEAICGSDPKIDFVMRKGAGPVPGWGDIYSIRWTGMIHPRYSERYTLRTENDDGVRVWIDGKRVIDDWKGRMIVGENRGEIELEAGKSYHLKVEYFNGGDIGVLRLSWSSASQKEEIVPPSQLSP